MTPDELRQTCADALAASRNLRAFLAVVRAGEGTSDPDGYRRHYGGSHFDGWADHPRKVITAGRWTSSAAGAYQFLSRTWEECARALGLTDFSPRSQDLAAVYLIRRRGALPDAMAGRLEAAIAKCAPEWASLPGSPYGQPTRSLDQARQTYLEAGGALAGTTTPEADMPIPAIVAALLPTLASAIPDLAKLIKPDSESAQKNAAVAAKVFEVAKGAIDAVNEQAVVEAVQSDPQAMQRVRQAVQDRWFEIVELAEAGGGGIDGARKADAISREKGDLARSPSFWIAFALLPLVYLLVLSLIGLIGSATWSDDVRAGLAGSLMSAIVGGLVGYYYGQTTSRNRTPAAGRS